MYMYIRHQYFEIESINIYILDYIFSNPYQHVTVLSYLPLAWLSRLWESIMTCMHNVCII